MISTGEYPIKQLEGSSEKLCSMKDYLQAEGRKNKETILGKTDGWLLEGHFPAGVGVQPARSPTQNRKCT